MGLDIAEREMELSPEEFNSSYFGTRHGSNSMSYAYCPYSSGMQSRVKAFGGAERHEHKQ